MRELELIKLLAEVTESQNNQIADVLRILKIMADKIEQLEHAIESII